MVGDAKVRLGAFSSEKRVWNVKEHLIKNAIAKGFDIGTNKLLRSR